MNEHELKLSRTFDAPLETVWRAWAEPVHAKVWFGPQGFTAPVYEADLREGGRLYYEMQARDGTRFPSQGTIEEIASPTTLVVTGAVTIGGEKAFDSRTRVKFSADGARTRMDVVQTYWNVSELGKQAIEGGPTGWAQMLDKFASFLESHRGALQ